MQHRGVFFMRKHIKWEPVFGHYHRWVSPESWRGPSRPNMKKIPYAIEEKPFAINSCSNLPNQQPNALSLEPKGHMCCLTYKHYLHFIKQSLDTSATGIKETRKQHWIGKNVLRSFLKLTHIVPCLRQSSLKLHLVIRCTHYTSRNIFLAS